MTTEQQEGSSGLLKAENTTPIEGAAFPSLLAATRARQQAQKADRIARHAYGVVASGVKVE